jgi:hypothetical protein
MFVSVELPAHRFGVRRAEAARIFSSSLLASLLMCAASTVLIFFLYPSFRNAPSLLQVAAVVVLLVGVFVLEAFDKGVFYFGFRHDDTKSERNIRTSGILGGCSLAAGAVSGAVLFRFYSPFEFQYGLLPWISDHDMESMKQLWYLVGPLLLAFPIAAIVGGASWLRFVALRRYLALRRELPLDLLGFLRYGEERAVLKRSGDPFAFYHRLLRDHFAEQMAGAGGQFRRL